MFSFGIIAKNFEVFENEIFDCKVGVHSLHTGLINASHSTKLFIHSGDHIFTNGKAPLHSHINPAIPLSALSKG